MSFLETPRFPDNVAYGSRGGPAYRTRVIQVDSGHSKRWSRWQYPLHRYDVSYGVRSESDMYAVLEHFHACGGRAHTFRIKDYLDYKSNSDMSAAISATDQTIGTGDGAETDFQLIKTYTRGALSRARKISKPIAPILISLDDAPQASGWSVDTTTGLVSFSSAPGIGVVVKAGFEYDVPVEFADDSFEPQWDDQAALSAGIMLQEIRL